jgi:hypothetical protein
MKISSFALPVLTARGNSRISENVAGLSSEFLFPLLIGVSMASFATTEKRQAKYVSPRSVLPRADIDRKGWIQHMKSVLGVLLMLISGTIPTWAVLGQYESSVSVDQEYMKSEDRVQDFQAYKVHELTSASGTIIREYVSSKGLVFGVAWRAPFMPNMEQLLGSYVTNLQTASKSQTHVRHLRGLIVKTDDFVFVSNGRMRFWKGSAYVPSLVPNNVSVEVVR